MPTRATKKRAVKKAVVTNNEPEEKKPEMLKEEKINHPNHYQHESGVECIAVAEKLGFNPCLSGSLPLASWAEFPVRGA